MLGKKENGDNINMLVVTTEEIYGKTLMPLGLVTAAIPGSKVGFRSVKEALIQEALMIGADAIVGFRASLLYEASTRTTQTAYGTAVKFIED